MSLTSLRRFQVLLRGSAWPLALPNFAHWPHTARRSIRPIVGVTTVPEEMIGRVLAGWCNEAVIARRATVTIAIRCYRLPLADNLIVTPFAQILHSLRTVRNNYVAFTNLPPEQQQSKSVAHFHDIILAQLAELIVQLVESCVCVGASWRDALWRGIQPAKRH